MNIYLMVDMEGISGIYSSEQVDIEKGTRYQEGRALMTREVNECVEGLKDAGVDKVYVRDCHGQGCNIIWDQLSEQADCYFIGDSGTTRYPGIEECDGVILLGYHAMAGTPGAILEHTMSGESVQNYWVNGKRVGETGIDAGIAGDLGKPIMMVSGDDKLCAEAQALMPSVVTAEVKKGMSLSGGRLLPPARAYALLREKIAEAVDRLPEMKSLNFDKPIHLRVECVERCPSPSAYSKPYMTIIDGRTYEVEGATMEEALFRL